MNYMKQVAQMLGVELEEEFYIKGYYYKYKITNNGMSYFVTSEDRWAFARLWLFHEILLGILEIVKIPKPILDDVEKEYLSNVIKPFRNQVKFIEKNLGTDQYDNEYEFIRLYLISVKVNSSDEILDFPYYKADTMYKGMELDKEYTLEELGL